jgi:protein-S-isoprenylcysteine O-methyltransferase Ste14
LESAQKRGIGKEHPQSLILQLLAGIIFFLIWILDSFIFHFSCIFTVFIPFILRLILFLSLLTIGCLLIFITGHILFHTKKNSSTLILEGIFAHVRHPLYLGIIVIYVGFILFTMSLISFIGWIVIIIIYDRIATFEENELEKLFKGKYSDYKKLVPKWIPKI